MKKKIIAYVLLITMIMLILIPATGCSINQEQQKPYIADIDLEGYTSDKKLEPAQELLTCNVDEYIMDLTLDTKKKRLSGEVVMNLTNQTEDVLNKICIRNYAASILEKAKKGSSKIESIMITETNENLNFDVQADASVIYADLFQHTLEPGKTISLKVTFCTDIPAQKSRFGYIEEDKNSIFQLSFCFPMIAMYENEKWNENPYVEVGEPTYSKITNYHVTLHAPEEYVIVASGNEETQGTITTIEGENMRDMSIVASNYMNVETETICGVQINNYVLDYEHLETYNELSMESAKDAVALYTELIGKFPYEELDVVQTFISGGMEYPGLVMIGYPNIENVTDIYKYSSYESLCVVIAHEVAHQWFYVAIGNDQYMEPWLDEGFAQYCSNVLYLQSGKNSLLKAIKSDNQRDRIRSNTPKCATENEFNEYMSNYVEQVIGEKYIINKPYYAYLGKDGDYKEYVQHIYDGGSFFLYELREAMGDGAFFHMLKEYYNNYYMNSVKGTDFIEAVKTFDDSGKVDKIVEKYIETAN